MLQWILISLFGALLLVLGAGVGGSSTLLLAAQDRLRRRRHLDRITTALAVAGLSRTDAARWEGVLDDDALASLEALGRVPGRVRLQIEVGELQIGSRSLDGGRPTGDPQFDRWLRVRGPAGDRARLTADARRQLLELRHCGRLTLRDGQLALRLTRVPPDERTRVVEALGALAATLECRRTHPVQRLVALVRDDPVTAVRIRALFDLEAVDRPSAHNEAWHALDDPEPEFRLACARLRGLDQPLRDAVVDADLSDRVRAQAARWLLGLIGDTDIVQIARALADSQRPELEEAAVALALHASDETTLIRLLQAHSPTALRAALVALRGVGTSASVPMLRELELQSAALTSRRRLASEALEAIRSRGAAHAGGLTLAELGELVGAVSPTDIDGGLSLS